MLLKDIIMFEIIWFFNTLQSVVRFIKVLQQTGMLEAPFSSTGCDLQGECQDVEIAFQVTLDTHL